MGRQVIRHSWEWTVPSALACVIVCAVGIGAQTPRHTKVVPETVEQTAKGLGARIKETIQSAGGDPEHQHVHLVWGFSTGHFSKDPLAAEAARAIAWVVSRDFLVQNDHVSAYAWEITLWEHPGSSRNPIVVPSDAVPEKERIKDLWPLSAQAGSLGGHDTERAIVEITERLGAEQDAVMVLITNTAASIISGSGAKVIGANDPRYQNVLQGWNRLPQVNTSGASLELPFTVMLPTGAPIQRTLDAVILVPRSFVGKPFEKGTRSERLRTLSPPKVQPSLLPKPPQSSRSGWSVFGLILALLLLTATITYLLFSRGSGLISALFSTGPILLEVNGHRFSLANVNDGEEICHLAGPNFPEPNNRTAVITGEQEIPPIRLARLLKEGGRVRVEGDKLKLHSVDGAVETGSHRLTPGSKHRLVFRGEYSSDPALPAEQVRVEVEVQLRRVQKEGEGNV